MFDTIEYKSDYDDDPKEGLDYELTKDGYRIMTKYFLIKRGYCCGNGCLNCPYFPKATKGNTNLRDSISL